LRHGPGHLPDNLIKQLCISAASLLLRFNLQVITPLLRILEKMHSMMLLHRDIKPENIFLTSMGKFKLGDFGLAIRFDKELAFSRSGTLDYMAPEVGVGLRGGLQDVDVVSWQLAIDHSSLHVCHVGVVSWTGKSSCLCSLQVS
jgi:serine/threonine protein kinase